MSYTVSTEIINPWGICVGELNPEDYNPYATWRLSHNSGSGQHAAVFSFESYHGTYRYPQYQITDDYMHRFTVSLRRLILDYVRRVYNVPDDIDIVVSSNSDYQPGVERFHRGTQQTFETKAEALEYVDGLGNPEPIITISNSVLFNATWQQQIEGAFIDRAAELNYTGDPVTLYTINNNY